MHHVVQLAREAQQAGNLPIGAVVSLNGKVVPGGRNSIWVPEFNLSKHAEFEALKAVPAELWARSKEMTLYYTTLEPCLMCIGAIFIVSIASSLVPAIAAVVLPVCSVTCHLPSRPSYKLWNGSVQCSRGVR
jgi:tRNA(adenine34) deaminase